MRERTGDEGARPIVGSEVWSADDQHLGRVAEVTQSHLRLAADDGHERWILASTVRSAAEDRTTVGFPAAELEDQAAAAPAADTGGTRRVEDQTPHISPDAVIPDPEEQREVMLRELAEQREQMRDEGTATADADRNVGEPVEQELERRESGERGGAA
jgi:hypothetical protein